MSHPRLLAVVAAATLLTTPTLGAQGRSAMRTEVQNIVRAYIDAHNRADATALMDIVKRTPEATSVNNGEIIRGWEAIRTETDELTGKEGSFKVAIGTMDVTPLGTVFALVVAPTTITVATDQGVVQLRGAVTLVLEKTTTGWKVVNEHYSTKAQ